MNFAGKVQQTFERNTPFRPGHPFVVALSGGADSVALLRVLLELGYRVAAAVHCNFHLRGAESDRDEAFVRTLCGELGVELEVAHFDTRLHAAQRKISIEMAARELRYEFFGQMCEKYDVRYVAVAHHRDDNAETLLLNLVRGTGLRGLCGMEYVAGGIVRPLLDVSRGEIVDYLASLHQHYVTDSTNLHADVKRNKIRLELMPLLRELNPSIAKTLHREAAKFRSAERMYRLAVSGELAKIERNAAGDETLRLDALSAGCAPDAVLHEWLYAKGFNETQVVRAAQAACGDESFQLEAADYLLFFERGAFTLVPKASLPDFAPIALPDEGQISVGCDCTLTVERRLPPVAREELLAPQCAFLDAASVTPPLCVRPLQSGDRFVPFGMRGTKLVNDYLAERRVPVWERRRTLVVADAGKIVWLAGLRVDDRAKITPATQSVIALRISRA